MAKRRHKTCRPWVLYRAAVGEDRMAVARRISRDDGERGVSRGAMAREYDSCGQHVGYRMVERTDHDLPSGSQSGAITASEMELYAGRRFRGGRSRTKRMSEERRLTRVDAVTGKKLPPEDDVERVEAKVAAYGGLR